jgi:hypothetical protein
MTANLNTENIGTLSNSVPVINSEQELEEYTSVLFSLTQKPTTAPDEDETIELLTQRIEQYETEHFSVFSSNFFAK